MRVRLCKRNGDRWKEGHVSTLTSLLRRGMESTDTLDHADPLVAAAFAHTHTYKCK